MFKQFWIELGLILGLALITFIGYSLPHWVLLSPEVQSDALPLRGMLFLNAYLPFILAFICFCTGAFLPFKSGYSSPRHLIFTFFSICLIAFFAANAADAWQYRLPNARQRLALLEQKSLQHRSAETAVHHTQNLLLVGMPVRPDTGQPSPILPVLAAKIDDELYIGGTLFITNWRLEGSVHLESPGTAAGNSRAAHPLSPSEGIDDLIPEVMATFIAHSIDQSAARFFQWPIAHPKGENTPKTEGLLFLLGLAVFACGCGLLVNKRGASLIQILEDISIFLFAVALPVTLLHLWWLSYGGGDTAEEPKNISSALAFIRPVIVFAIGIPCLFTGLRRRKQMESRQER
jgi:hypothetical protein